MSRRDELIAQSIARLVMFYLHKYLDARKVTA